MINKALDLLNECVFFALKIIGIVLLKVVYRIGTENQQWVPRQGPLIVAANHFSYMDPIALQAIFPRRIVFMMTELYYEGRGKWLFQLLRCICVKEQGSNRAALEAGIESLKKNEALGIFPEGGVSREGRLQEGNPGIGFLALKSGAPVVPAFISGTYEAFPKGARMPRISKIKIVFGRPMSFGHRKDISDRERIGEITGQIMDCIRMLSHSGSCGNKPVFEIDSPAKF